MKSSHSTDRERTGGQGTHEEEGREWKRTCGAEGCLGSGVEKWLNPGPVFPATW